MKRVLITGANKGIGFAIANAVLEADEASFVYLGSRDAARGDEACKKLKGTNAAWADRVEAIRIDVSSDESVAAAAKQVDSLYGIVNNAGIGFGASDMKGVLDVNTLGPRRVIEAFLPSLAADGRIVNVSSAAGPNFVSRCSDERKAAFTNPDVTWSQIRALMDECLALHADAGDFGAAGFGTGDAYGLSKACLNAYTIELARAHPSRTINACTPGFIETDLTRSFASARGASPADMGMKPPAAGAKAPVHLLFGEVGGSGWYFGSDAVRSPIDRYRSPGDPPYTGD